LKKDISEVASQLRKIMEFQSLDDTLQKFNLDDFISEQENAENTPLPVQTIRSPLLEVARNASRVEQDASGDWRQASIERWFAAGGAVEQGDPASPDVEIEPPSRKMDPSRVKLPREPGALHDKLANAEGLWNAHRAALIGAKPWFTLSILYAWLAEENAHDVAIRFGVKTDKAIKRNCETAMDRVRANKDWLQLFPRTHYERPEWIMPPPATPLHDFPLNRPADDITSAELATRRRIVNDGRIRRLAVSAADAHAVRVMQHADLGDGQDCNPIYRSALHGQAERHDTGKHNRQTHLSNKADKQTTIWLEERGVPRKDIEITRNKRNTSFDKMLDDEQGDNNEE
jgi:hypothetical protein